VNDFAFANRLHGHSQAVEARNIRCERIAGHPNYDEPKRELLQLELTLEFAVDSHEDVKPALGKPEERAIFTSWPAGFRHRRNSMSRKCSTHTSVNTFV
jgi:hypothetical protein